MALKENLAAAEAAVAYVKGLKILAINTRAGRIEAAGGIDNVVGTEQGMASLGKLTKYSSNSQIQAAGGPLVASFMRARNGGYNGEPLRDRVARFIKEKAGNCDEQAEIAMVYLMDNYPACRPISKMGFNNKAGGYDHAWVVIGLEDDYNKASPIGGQNLRNWGADAVWCDPWQSGGVAFAVQDLVKGGVRNLNAIYKCNTAESVAAGNPTEILYIGP